MGKIPAAEGRWQPEWLSKTERQNSAWLASDQIFCRQPRPVCSTVFGRPGRGAEWRREAFDHDVHCHGGLEADAGANRSNQACPETEALHGVPSETKIVSSSTTSWKHQESQKFIYYYSPISNWQGCHICWTSSGRASKCPSKSEHRPDWQRGRHLIKRYFLP